MQFAVGAATLNADAKVALARFAGIVGIYRVDAVPGGRTHGHDRERRDQSRALARPGEFSVRDYLAAQGVEAERISVVGLGPDQPVADNATSQGRARNRRVEIILTGDPCAGDLTKGTFTFVGAFPLSIWALPDD